MSMMEYLFKGRHTEAFKEIEALVLWGGVAGNSSLGVDDVGGERALKPTAAFPPANSRVGCPLLEEKLAVL